MAVKTWLSLCLVFGEVREAVWYLLRSSCKPTHTKQSIPFSMALRLRRICSTDEFFNTRSSALTTRPIKRGYKHRLVKDTIEKIRQIPRSAALETSIKKESHIIPFVITFNPALPNIPQAISSNLDILFTTVPWSIFFSSSYIVPPLQKLTWHTGQGQTPEARTPSPASGAFRCHRNRCKTCPFITAERTTSYTFFLYLRTKTHTTLHHLLFFQSRLSDTVQQMQRAVYLFFYFSSYVRFDTRLNFTSIFVYQFREAGVA